MLFTALGIFSLAVILGMVLLSYVLTDKTRPKAVVFAHGLIAAAGIVLLIVYAFVHAPAPFASIILFVLAALGGFLLFYKEMTGKPVPKWLAILHGLVAIAGFLFLLIFTVLHYTR